VKKIIRVYVAGPITQGGHTSNLRQALDAGAQLIDVGFQPFIPHESMLLALRHPEISYERYLEMDFAWIDVCEALLRLPGESPGADREVEYAKTMQIPVVYSVAELIEYAR
jgi:hypothetical protein